MKWSNWAGNVSASPAVISNAADEQDLLRILADAARTKLPVRAVGAGHSFAPICATDGMLVMLADSDECRVSGAGVASLWAGTRIGTAAEALWRKGYSFANQGDIDVQSMAGALGTGTHGTGPSYGSFSAATESVRLLTAAGEVLELDRQHDENLLRAAALSVGMLGLICNVGIRVVPIFQLREETRDVSVADCVETFNDVSRLHRNTEFYWVPAFDRCVLKTIDLADGETISAGEEGELPPPGTMERYLRPVRVNRAYLVFRNIRTVPFLEMEYSVPIDDGLDCFQEIRTLMQMKFPEKSWVVEYRTQAADDLLLSPAYGRAVATISVHDAPDVSSSGGSEDYFRACEEIFLACDGRPHWGKLCFLPAARRAERFPEFDRFAAVRARLDPDGVFLNEVLRPMFH